MRRLSSALRALTGRPSSRAASRAYWRIATGISWVRPTAPASLSAFGLPLDSCTTTARSNAGSMGSLDSPALSTAANPDDPREDGAVLANSSQPSTPLRGRAHPEAPVEGLDRGHACRASRVDAE